MEKPKIRFKGYQEDWEQRKLLSCIKKITDFRGRTPKKLGMDWSENGYLALSALNVKDGYIDFSQDVHYGDQELYDKWMSGNELHEGQVLFTTEAPMGNVAQVPDNKRYILSQRTIAFDVKNDIITENFLATLLRSPSVFNTLTSLSSGGTAKGVSQKSLAGVDVQIPIDLREQTMLADYFHSLDHLITLHQRKCEETKILKKYMLQKMFPQNGHSVPEIRFSGFTEDWEQRKLGELGTVQTCKRIFKEQTSEQGDIPFFKNGTIGLEPDSYISREVYEEFRRLYPYPEVGDTLISVVGSIGRTAEYVGKDEYFQDSNVVWLKTDGSINKKFLKISYQVIKWLIEGSTVKHLYNDNILRSEIVMPVSQIEQAKIAEFFEALDHLITLHQQKCNELRNIKKFMLQNMFI